MSTASLLDSAPLNAWSKLKVASLDTKSLTVDGSAAFSGDLTVSGQILAGGSVRGSGLSTTARGGLADRWSIADITAFAGATYAPAAASTPSSFSFCQSGTAADITIALPSDADMRANFALLGIPVADGVCVEFVVVNQSTAGANVIIDPTGEPAYIPVFSGSHAIYGIGPGRAATIRMWFRSGSGAYIFNCNF